VIRPPEREVHRVIVECSLGMFRSSSFRNVADIPWERSGVVSSPSLQVYELQVAVLSMTSCISSSRMGTFDLRSRTRI